MSITLKQTASNAALGTKTVIFGSNITAGSAIVVFSRFYQNTNALAAPTDTLGNTYRPFAVSGDKLRYGWVALNSASGANTITLPTNAISGDYQAVAAEYAGVASAKAVEGSVTTINQSTSTATSFPLGVINTAQANDLIVAFFSTDGASFVAPTNFTKQVTCTAGNTYLCDYIPPSASANTVTASSVASAWGAAAIILSAASIAAPTTSNAAFGGVEGSGSSTLSTYAFQTTTGKAIVVAVGIGAGNDPATVITSITDTAGNAYTAIPNAYVKSGNSGIKCYVCIGATGNAANVISANLTGSNTYSGIWAWEVDNFGSVDQVATATGTNTTPTSGSFTPAANELVLAVTHQYSANQLFVAGSGYNSDISTGGLGITTIAAPMQGESLVAPAVSSQTAGFTGAANGPAWSVVAITIAALPTGAPTLQQTAVGWQIGAFGTTLPTLAGSVGAGDQIIVWVASIGGHGTCTGCTDNVGNTYTQVYTATLGAQPIFYCFLATNTSLQAGGITITPTKSAGGTYLVSCIFDYSSSGAFTFDQATGQSTGSGTKNLFAPTTATLAQAVEVATVFMVEVSSDNQSVIPTIGFALRGHEYGDPVLGEYWASSDMITAATTAISNPGFTGAANWTGNCPVAIALFYVPSYSISGSAGVAGATVSYTGTSSGSVVADGSGNYTISGLSNGSYTITPSLTGYSFSPTNSSQTVSGSNITGVNFTATHLTVATATFSPVAGTYQKAQTVTVSNTNSGLGGFAMYYTTDGSTPTTGSTPISNGGTVSISVTTTLKVLSVATGYINSIATGQFNIVQGTGDGLQYSYRFRF